MSKIIQNCVTSFMDDPYCKKRLFESVYLYFVFLIFLGVKDVEAPGKTCVSIDEWVDVWGILVRECLKMTSHLTRFCKKKLYFKFYRFLIVLFVVNVSFSPTCLQAVFAYGNYLKLNFYFSNIYCHMPKEERISLGTKAAFESV